jgi:hypothetical protein
MDWPSKIASDSSGMFKLGALMFVLIIASGCEVIWTAPPASGRVLDSRSNRSIAGASVARIAISGTTNQTISDADGHFKFRGKRSVQMFPFGDALAWATYRIEAAGYQSVETNRAGYGSINGLRHEFGEIPLSPK